MTGTAFSWLALPLRVRMGRWQGCPTDAFSLMAFRKRVCWLRSNTALHLASTFGSTETALALVEAGADVHGQNNDGYGVWLARTPHARAYGSVAGLCDRWMQSDGVSQALL